MEKIIALVAAVLGVLGIDAVLGDKGEMPNGLHERVMDKVSNLVKLRDVFNTMAAGLQRLEQGVLSVGAGVPAGTTSLTSAQILDTLPGIVALAAHGRTYIADLRADALKWFDSAKVQKNKELTEAEKQIRAVIAGCGDIPQLKAYITEYQAAAEARFGPQGGTNRVSQGADVDPPQESAEHEDIVDAARTLFGKEAH